MVLRERTLQSIESAIRCDPAGRGLLDQHFPPLGLGELARAARSLATAHRSVAIVTGFFVPEADPPAAETDGPPGAVALAIVLGNLGIASILITDSLGAGAVRAAMDAGGIDPSSLHVPKSSTEIGETIDRIRPSHVIAVERLGRTYDAASLKERWGGAEAGEFRDRVRREDWSRLLNMRGRPMEEWTLDYSILFDDPPPGTVTIGIGDGGNEIGMGKFPWREMVGRIPNSSPPGILSRVPCDHTILAGTSNWGALGLAAAVASARHAPEAFSGVTPAHQQDVLRAMVENGSAVDGVTGRAEASVDGLDFETESRPLHEIRHELGLVSP